MGLKPTRDLVSLAPHAEHWHGLSVAGCLTRSVEDHVTMLNVLQRKGKVTRELQGRAYLYAPAVSRVQASRQALGDLVHRMFDGSAESLVLSLVEARQLTPEKLAELSTLIDKSEAEDGDERA